MFGRTILAVALVVAGVYTIAAQTASVDPLVWGVRCCCCLLGGYLLATLGVA